MISSTMTIPTKKRNGKMIPTESHKRQDAAFPRVSVQRGTKKKRERKRKEISPKWDSNTRPAAYEADALPTELLRHVLASLFGYIRQGTRSNEVKERKEKPQVGFEHTTCRLRSGCSTN